MKQTIKNFNNLIKNTIFNVQNKTNNKSRISKFNNLIQKTIIKVQNKTNNKSKISNFNKYLISFISLLFCYLFYLSIPVLYDKSWVQNNIEKKLYKEFKINFSTSSDISFYILPAPHFLIKDSKIFSDNIEKKATLSEIKSLKVFISQKNLFNKEKLDITEVIIDNANFLLSRKSLKLLSDYNSNRFSKKEIKIKNSNIFFKDKSNETIAIFKISKALLFFDDKNLLNLFNLKGEAFNVPFTFDIKKIINPQLDTEINIDIKDLKLKIYDVSSKKNKNLKSGKNTISLLKSKIDTKYNIEKNIITFESSNSRIKNTRIEYKGKLSTDPSDLELDIDLGKYNIFKLFNSDSILIEFIRSKLLFNRNISLNSTIVSNSDEKELIFHNKEIALNIINGKMNLNKTKLVNKKIGTLEIENSNFFFKDNKLTLNSEIVIDIKNFDHLFSLLQTNKRSRKPIKTILVNLDYQFLTNQIEFNKIRVDNKEISGQLLTIIEGLNDTNINNLNKSKRILNKFIEAYEG